MIPYHEDFIPVYVKGKEGWEASKLMPLASMVGCNRAVKERVGYLGDSITQGWGTPFNSYSHWNALLSQMIGSEYAYWNLGLGFGRANDAASDGAWLYRARQNDIIFVCYGVNDIEQGFSEEQTKADLTYIVETLKKEGKKVILQTIPPCNYRGEAIEQWNNINMYIKTVLADKVDAVFDVVPHLGDKENPHNSKFGGHPNQEGCAIWAKALFEEIKQFF